MDQHNFPVNPSQKFNTFVETTGWPNNKTKYYKF